MGLSPFSMFQKKYKMRSKLNTTVQRLIPVINMKHCGLSHQDNEIGQLTQQLKEILCLSCPFEKKCSQPSSQSLQVFPYKVKIPFADSIIFGLRSFVGDI